MATRKSPASKWWDSKFVQDKFRSFAAKYPLSGKLLADQHDSIAAIFTAGTVQHDKGNWAITDSQNRTYITGGHQCDCKQNGLCIHRLVANFAYWLNLPLDETNSRKDLDGAEVICG